MPITWRAYIIVSSSGHGVKYTLQADDISRINMTFIVCIFIIINSVYLLFDIVICLISVDSLAELSINHLYCNVVLQFTRLRKNSK